MYNTKLAAHFWSHAVVWFFLFIMLVLIIAFGLFVDMVAGAYPMEFTYVSTDSADAIEIIGAFSGWAAAVTAIGAAAYAGRKVQIQINRTDDQIDEAQRSNLIAQLPLLEEKLVQAHIHHETLLAFKKQNEFRNFTNIVLSNPKLNEFIFLDGINALEDNKKILINEKDLVTKTFNEETRSRLLDLINKASELISWHNLIYVDETVWPKVISKNTGGTNFALHRKEYLLGNLSKSEKSKIACYLKIYDDALEIYICNIDDYIVEIDKLRERALDFTPKHTT